MVNWTSLIPPNPSTSVKGNESAENGDGGKILGLLRSYERAQKQEKDDDSVSNKLDSLESEIISNLQSMQAEFLRRGLLKGDIDRAEDVISKTEKKMMDGSANNNSNSGQQNGGGKRRKRGGASGNRSTGIFSSQDILNSESGSSIGDELLVMSALNRVLGTGNSSSKEKAFSIFSCDVVKAAADVLMSICYFTDSNLHVTSACIQVEHDLIIGMHSQLLNGIANLMNTLLEQLEEKSNGEDTCNNPEDEVEALSSCCKASAKIISIAGTRLSRSAKLIEKLKSSAKTFLFHKSTNTSAMASAVALLATLPLVGNMDGLSPQKLWSNLVQKETTSLCAILNTFFPLQRSGSKYLVEQSDQAWIQIVREEVPSQTDRLVIFQRRVEGTAMLLLSLLNFDIYNPKTQAALAHVAVPIHELMDLSEFMLTFPSAAEIKYFSTKTRLRDLSVDNGLLSPNAAMMVANMVQYYGHDLFDSCVSSLQTNSLLYGKRIIRVAFASLQSCSSLVVKKTVDPSSMGKHHEGKKRRWLQGSLELRIKAMKSIKTMIQSIGSNIVINQTAIVHKILKLVVGCLFEQIEMQSFSHCSKNDWGAMKDRVLLTEVCIDVLASFVAVCIGFLPYSFRSLIDSVAMTCFDIILGKRKSLSTLTFSSVKTALLNLGTNCVCAPYSDGTANGMICVVHEVSSSLRFDRNPNVASAAYSTLCVCNALMTQRAPPLVITTHTSVSDKMNGLSANNIELATSDEFMDALKSTISDTMKKEASDKKRRKDDDSSKEREVSRQDDNKRQKQTEPVKGQGIDDAKEENFLAQTTKQERKKEKSLASHDQIIDKSLANNDQKIENSIKDKDNITPGPDKHQFSEEKQTESYEKNSGHKVHSIRDENEYTGKQSSDDGMSEDEFPEIIDCDPDE